MFSNITKVLTLYLNVGINDNNQRDTNHLIFVSNLFSFVGYSLTFPLAVSAYYRDNEVLSYSLLFASALFFTCHHIHRFPQLGDTVKISTSVVLFSLIALMLSLVYSGGYANTGPLWAYLVPPVALFFGGLKKGLRNTSLFLLVITIMLFFPNDLLLGTHYPSEFRSRLVFSLLSITTMFGYYEYSRQKSYNTMLAISQEYEQKAMQDLLTKLPNRRGMRAHLNYEYERTKRSSLPLTILVCDIDHFKAINDAFMHDGGDYVLEKLSELFSQTIRKQDYTARWGGEEFLFLLPETSAADAFVLAEKLRKTIQDTVFNYKGKEIKITLSIGLSEITPDTNIDQAINNADRYLYEAKQNGRNQVSPTFSAS